MPRLLKMCENELAEKAAMEDLFRNDARVSVHP